LPTELKDFKESIFFIQNLTLCFCVVRYKGGSRLVRRSRDFCLWP